MLSEVKTPGRATSAGRSTRTETAGLLDQPCQCRHCGLLSIELRLVDHHFFARYGLDACRQGQNRNSQRARYDRRGIRVGYLRLKHPLECLSPTWDGCSGWMHIEAVRVRSPDVPYFVSDSANDRLERLRRFDVLRQPVANIAVNVWQRQTILLSVQEILRLLGALLTSNAINQGQQGPDGSAR